MDDVENMASGRKRTSKNNNPVAKKVNRLPRLVRLICTLTDAWIVGSAADPDNDSPKDYDVAVPLELWQKVAHVIPPEARPTMFGGWKCMSSGMEVDVWPDNVVGIFMSSKCEWMWQPSRNIRIHKVK